MGFNKKSKQDGHTNYVQSVCFSPDGIHQLLVVMITLSFFGMLQQNNKKQNWMVIVVLSCQSVSFLMETHQYHVVEITLSVSGISKQDNKKPNQIVILIVSTQSVSLLMEIHQHLVVMISLSVYGMLKQDRKFNPQIIDITIYWKIARFHCYKTTHLQLLLTFLFSVYPKHQSLKLKELLYLRESLLFSKALTQDCYQNQEDVAFWKAVCKNVIL
ncbi:unnamed protein product [Paramecium primaurelia]|uniref:Transmembrane protein n=1 Tax=Paramecium primaurelia TaxID=5886 RepID=A0A8S1QMJ9_PARPR|nr:unnamed protein product [Paramecium primaurelia]